MDKLHIAYCLITLSFIVWGSGYLSEHTPIKNFWDFLVFLLGIIFLSWYSLIFYMLVFEK
jgi:hypothetical protein